jgi:ABC-type uncharacterized transport system permease subunit
MLWCAGLSKYLVGLGSTIVVFLFYGRVYGDDLRRIGFAAVTSALIGNSGWFIALHLGWCEL